jgi:general secretion pathway protein C
MLFRATVIAMLSSLIVIAVSAKVHYASVLVRSCEDARALAPAPPQSDLRHSRAMPETIIVDTRRAELERMLETPTLMSQARLVPLLRDGQATGIKVYALRPDTLLSALGLHNGDTLVTINNISVTDHERCMELYSNLESIDFVDIGVRRHGHELRIIVLIHP